MSKQREAHIFIPWCAGIAECFDCQREWVAVWPLGADDLKCPSCHSTNTDRTAHEKES